MTTFITPKRERICVGVFESEGVIIYINIINQKNHRRCSPSTRTLQKNIFVYHWHTNLKMK